MVELTINDQKVQAEEGASVLRAAEKAGIKIPTLCSNKALSPYGACRLCLVEVAEPGRPASIQASCTYPVSPGLSVRTDTERVLKTRRMMMELHLARCPEVEQIRRMAKELGVEKSRFEAGNDDCTLCGLCVRMCRERMGPAVLGFTGRGSKREVKPPYGIPSEFCQTCGACVFICPTGRMKIKDVSVTEPVPILSEHNEGLASRGAVFIPFPQAVPNKAIIDEKSCVHMLKEKCGICEVYCEAKAIDYGQKESLSDLKVGAVVLAPGYEAFDARLKSEYGYGHYPNVVTALEFERILSASGPFDGHVLRPSDLTVPGRIAWIQCVGSRDSERNYCSSVCCMYATKEAIIAKEHVHGELRCDIFFMDLRAFGKGFDEYYERAKAMGINYIRCRPSSVEEVPGGGSLRIGYLNEEGKAGNGEYDLVVLSTGLVAPRSMREAGSRLGVRLDEHGFCSAGEFSPCETGRDGVFACGPFAEPKDIPETVIEASGAATRAISLLAAVRGSLIKTRVFPPETDVAGVEPRIGVFVCHCGTNIAGVVNVAGVVEYAKTLPNVVYAENNLYTCSNDTQEKIKKLIKEHDLNRVVVASCSPRTHEPLFRNTIREAGLNPYLFEMANIRDQCSWVHMHEPEKATAKARDLVRMALAKSRLLEPLKRKTIGMDKRVLVMGGGVSGMTAALELAGQGFEVHLVEKEKVLGGHLRHIHYTLGQNGGMTPRQYLEQLEAKVRANPRISLHLEAEVSATKGFIGNFESTVKGGGKSEDVKHGVVIVATGAREYEPSEFLYGQDSRVLTQVELEERLAGGGLGGAANIVMIQCVGSRTKEHPYCSRICCQEAVKNALKIKEIRPDANVFILYRDVRTYGFRESFYTKAREAGVVFIRYDENRPPEVEKGEKLAVRVHDPILGREVSIQPDLLVLSAATVPDPGNADTGKLFKIPLNQNGFFLEAHMKLRPVDFATEGVFLCGLAHAPKLIPESVVQAWAAVSRANTVLSKDEIELEANISEVIDENCDGCAYCVDPCPYKAIALIEYVSNGSVKKTVEVNESACKGCGTCMATCPKKGISVKGFRLEQLAAMVNGLLGGA